MSYRRSAAYDPERSGPSAVLALGTVFPSKHEVVFALALEPEEALELWTWLDGLCSRSQTGKMLGAVPDALRTNLEVYRGDFGPEFREALREADTYDPPRPRGTLLGRDIRLREDAGLDGTVTGVRLNEVRSFPGHLKTADLAVSPKFVPVGSPEFAIGYDLFGVPQLRRLLMFYAAPEALSELIRQELDYDPDGCKRLLDEGLVPDVGREPRIRSLARLLPTDAIASLLNHADPDVRRPILRALGHDEDR